MARRKIPGFFRKFVEGLRDGKHRAYHVGSGTKPPHVPRRPSRPLQRSPLLDHQGLPDHTKLTYGRGKDGLIHTIDGKPVKEYLEHLGKQRAKLYQKLRNEGTAGFSRKKVGPCNSVVFDRRTGKFYEANNKMLGDEIPNDLHPTLQNPLDGMTAHANAHPGSYSYPDGTTGDFPHFDTKPGTHSEVAASNQALWDRELEGIPTGPGAMSELATDNRFIWTEGLDGAPCCANCTAILGDIESFVGKFTQVMPPRTP